jgi:hypothetical protein
MTRTVYVYKDTDSSAPVLTGTANDFVNLLDKCLVAGYGSKSAAGWTKPYTGTSKAAFRNDTTDGTGTYYRIQDDLTSTNQRYAYVTMYESMSGIDSGTNPWRSTNAELGVQKSNTQDSTARKWTVVADNCAAHIMIQHGANGTDWEYAFIGDIFSFVPSDAYRGFVIGRYVASSMAGSSYTSYTSGNTNRLVGAAENGLGVVRAHTGTGSAIACGLHTDGHKGNSSGSASASYFGGSTFAMLAYPNAVNSGLFVAPVWVHQNTTSPYIVRGYMPGLWAPLHNRGPANNDTYSGSGSLSGKTFEAFNIYSSGQIHIETSNTWS